MNLNDTIKFEIIDEMKKHKISEKSGNEHSRHEDAIQNIVLKLRPEAFNLSPTSLSNNSIERPFWGVSSYLDENCETGEELSVAIENAIEYIIRKHHPAKLLIGIHGVSFFGEQDSASIVKMIDANSVNEIMNIYDHVDTSGADHVMFDTYAAKSDSGIILSIGTIDFLMPVNGQDEVIKSIEFQRHVNEIISCLICITSRPVHPVFASLHVESLFADEGPSFYNSILMSFYQEKGLETEKIDRNLFSNAYAGISALAPEKRSVITSVLMRVSRSRLVESFDDRIIFLGIAFEMLYSKDDERLEIAYRLKVRTCSILGLDYLSAKETYKTIGDFYRLRSNVAHGSITPESIKNKNIVDFAERTLISVILKIIKSGGVPDWLRYDLDATYRI